jgi:hypothetical protein
MPSRTDAVKPRAVYVGVRNSADSLAFPGVIGALENVSYGESGAAGDPAMNAAPSGGFVPLPFVLCEMNVVCASSAKRTVPGAGVADSRGAGDALALALGAGEGDGMLCAAHGEANPAHARATTMRASRTFG